MLSMRPDDMREAGPLVCLRLSSRPRCQIGRAHRDRMQEQPAGHPSILEHENQDERSRYQNSKACRNPAVQMLDERNVREEVTDQKRDARQNEGSHEEPERKLRHGLSFLTAM